MGDVSKALKLQSDAQRRRALAPEYDPVRRDFDLGVQWFEASGMTQAAAAKTLGITQPRFNQLLKGKIEIFSLDALVNMATSAGMRVGLSIRPVTSVRVPSAQPLKPAQPVKRSLHG